MIKTFGILTIILLIGVQFEHVTALRCYSCSYTTTSGDILCTTDPISLGGNNIVSCSKKYCTIIRQEYKDPAGKVQSFARGCEETPLFLNDVLEDASSKFYYRSCQSDLCNAGNGIGSTGGKLSGDTYEGENLLVKGLPGGSSSIVFSSLLLMLAVVVVTLTSDLLV